MRTPGKGEWYRGARFGMFIHWGIYSLLGRGEQVLWREHLAPSRYRRLADRFAPKRFDANEWAAIAKDAGMRYAVMTSKHHDGFCMFDTATTNYSSVKTAARRDFIGEYVEAFRRAGLRVGIYCSMADWGYPAYFSGPKRDPEGFKTFIRMFHEQVRELCTQYGKIDILWFDGDWPHSTEEWQSLKLERMIRSLQPGILINNRLFKRAPGTGDFDTPEQSIERSGRPWEACLTSTHRWWGWHPGDDLWKSPREIVLDLCQIAEGAGNFLLNVGPQPDGRIPAPFVRRLREVGRWTRANREALYDTEPGVCETTSIGYMTTKGQSAYLLVAYWPGKELHLCGLRTPVRSARILGQERKLAVVREGEHLYVRGLPAKAPDRCCTVIELRLDGKAQPYEWAKLRSWEQDMHVLARWAVT